MNIRTETARIRALGSSKAFTLTEVMITASLATMVLAAILAGHLFGIRLSGLTKAKLGANEEARKAINKLVEEIRSAKMLKIGNGTSNAFTEIAINQLQQGNSIQIYLSTNVSQYVRYYRDPADADLKRITNGAQYPSILASAITNSVVFTSEDYQGHVITNNQNNRVIGLAMQFYRIQYPIVNIGAGNYYDFYQLRTKITRRTLE
jgi:hypothetical protein